MCQKKRFELGERPDLTVFVTTSPKKTEYPPLESDEDILEIDLKISDSESEVETAPKESATKITPQGENQKKGVAQPIRTPISVGKSRLNSNLLTQVSRPSGNKGTGIARIPTVPKRKRQSPFVWPRSEPLAKRAPSPTFAQFNPGLVCPSATVAPPPTIVINNYYGGGYRAFKPPPTCTDPALMSRGQLRRFYQRSTPEQIAEAMAIRKANIKQ